MHGKYVPIFKALAAPFRPDEVKKLPEAAGARKGAKYVTARTVMNRLDEVLGPENWFDDYKPAGEDSILCLLTIRLPDGSTLTKQDAGGFAGMKDQGDDDKSGFSDAFKRAGVKFGVARYLYRDGIPNYSDRSGVSESASVSGHTPEPKKPAVDPKPEPENQQPAAIEPQAQSEGLGDWLAPNLWINLTDEVMRLNVGFQADHPDETGEIVIAEEVVMHLVYLTWDACLHPMHPSENPDTKLSQWVKLLESIYSRGPKYADRLRLRTKEFLAERYNQAVLKSGEKKLRGPR